MEVNALQSSRIDVSNLSLEQVAGNQQIPEAEKVQKASEAFEAVLLRQILEESQQPVFKSKLTGNSTADGIYRDMVVNQLADSISKSGSLGLAKSLNAQLQRQTTAHAPGPMPAARHTQPALGPLKGPAPAVGPSTKRTDDD
jgi:peptidoglycan hydrolase FlgJ